MGRENGSGLRNGKEWEWGKADILLTGYLIMWYTRRGRRKRGATAAQAKCLYKQYSIIRGIRSGKTLTVATAYVV